MQSSPLEEKLSSIHMLNVFRIISDLKNYQNNQHEFYCNIVL